MIETTFSVTCRDTHEFTFTSKQAMKGMRALFAQRGGVIRTVAITTIENPTSVEIVRHKQDIGNIHALNIKGLRRDTIL